MTRIAPGQPPQQISLEEARENVRRFAEEKLDDEDVPEKSEKEQRGKKNKGGKLLDPCLSLRPFAPILLCLVPSVLSVFLFHPR